MSNSQLTEVNSPALALRSLQRAVDNYVKYEDLKYACSSVLTDPLFKIYPGGVTRHHNYDGGLPVHTNEVLQFALALAVPANADFQILTVAVILHDYLKIRDYEKDGLYWRKTQYHDQIRHVAGGYANWLLLCRQRGIGFEFQDTIGHCLLSHHGQLEWGSPIVPQTKEAQILHYADMMSMMYGEGR